MSEITKTGQVVAVEKDFLQVELVTCSACGDCAVKSSCGLREYRKNIVKVKIDNASSYHIGDKVEVSLSSQKGIAAVLLAFVVPLFVLLATLIIGVFLGFSDIQNCICAIIILIPYYFALFLSRRVLENKFRCKLKITD